MVVMTMACAIVLGHINGSFALDAIAPVVVTALQ
jgi:hypothetical protein